jgi:hypothetical protein
MVFLLGTVVEEPGVLIVGQRDECQLVPTRSLRNERKHARDHGHMNTDKESGSDKN